MEHNHATSCTPIRFASRAVRKIYRVLVPHKLRTAIWIFRHRGFRGIFEHIKKKKSGRSFSEGISYRPCLIGNVCYKVCKIPACGEPLVSIVIPVFNQFDYTYKCVLSIVNTVRGIPYEIIIGDDMSADKTKEIKRYFPGITVHVNKTEHGFLMNCNRAAEPVPARCGEIPVQGTRQEHGEEENPCCRPLCAKF